MLTFLLALAPLGLAMLQIALIVRFWGPRTRIRRSWERRAEDDTSRSAERLMEVLGSLGLHTEASSSEAGARIAIICRDPRPIVGGCWVVHAVPDEQMSAASADVLMLADSVWSARGVKGVLVASSFSAQARAAVRAATQVVELLTWDEVAAARSPFAARRSP